MAKAEITVHGRDYSVACAPGQEARLRDLARRLDQRVARIAEAVGEVGEERLLLVAALAMLDELDAARRGSPDFVEVERRAANAILDAAARIDALAARAETRE